jgi:dolichol-phosphate mannosyltransferase
MGRLLAIALFLAQGVLAVRVFSRMASSAKGGVRVERGDASTAGGEIVSVLIPVLNEAERLRPCLDGAVAQGPEVAEILVVDGGSTDGTQDLVRRYAGRDTRVRLIDASPVPDDVNGKAYGLQAGLDARDVRSRWVLMLDADVRPDPALVTSLLAHAKRTEIDAFSIATLQRVSGAAEGLVHPSLLATLVYRFGLPGQAPTDPAMIQANGQCFFARADLLDEVGGFSNTMHTANEDVTVARSIAARGHPVGFYESDRLVAVEMYSGWREAWENWTRSLPMQDRYVPDAAFGLLEVALIQALPPWIAAVSWPLFGRRHPLTMLNAGLIVARLGTLAGMARAYETRPWTYWLSPLFDVPAVIRIRVMARRRIHRWRGRTIDTGRTT